MRMLPGKIGTIRREVEGKACASCGGNKYQIVLRCGNEIQKGCLFTQCRRCHTRRDLEEDDLGRGDGKASILFRYDYRPSYSGLLTLKSAHVPHEHKSQVRNRPVGPSLTRTKGDVRKREKEGRG